MTARIILHCDRTFDAHSMCPKQEQFQATDVESAREIAGDQGWRTHPDGKDYCPGCSGATTAREARRVVMRRRRGR